MGKVRSSEAAGSIILRMREDRGLSRAALAREAGIGARTLYALEKGESPNFGLGSYLRLLEILGLSMHVELDVPPQAPSTDDSPYSVDPRMFELADAWKLDDEEA
ncbi:MAG: helix-turn-helix domain-containing protein [Coriobacteriales bacterium]